MRHALVKLLKTLKTDIQGTKMDNLTPENKEINIKTIITEGTPSVGTTIEPVSIREDTLSADSKDSKLNKTKIWGNLLTGQRPNYYSPVPWHQQEGFLQPDHMTRLDRFPKIFETAQKFKPDAKRVLSFGCSTGEECQSLRKYFPNAEIVGVDLDYPSIQKARKTNKDKNIFFHTDLGATGKYDIVTCLMVFFCMEHPVPYRRFEEALKNLNNYINEDGYLMIYTSDHHPNWVEEITTQYEAVNVWTRTHEKNKKDYYNGYYRKFKSSELE